MPYPNYILDVQGRGGEDFVSIITAEAAMQGDYTGQDPVVLSCRNGLENIAGNVYWNGFVSTAANNITINAVPGHEANGVSQTNGGNGYRLSQTTAGETTLYIRDEFMVVEDFEIGCIDRTSLLHERAGNLTARRMIVNASGIAGARYVLEMSGTGATPGDPYLLENCWLMGDGAFQADLSRVLNQTTPIKMVNCTIYGTGYGVITTTADFEAINTVAYGSLRGDFFSSNGTYTNCASGDSTATGVGAVTGVTSAAFVDSTGNLTGDFTPAALGLLDNAGTDPTVLLDDITNIARSSPCEIGAYEIPGAAPSAELTLPTVVPAETSAEIGCTTDTAGGTLYWYVSTSATAPSAADLKAGTGAVSSGSFTPILGANTVNATGLTASTQYWHYWIQDTI